MPEYKRYDIASYVVWLQRASRDFGGMLQSPVTVMATIGCHPSDTTDFRRLRYVFIAGDNLPADRIRERPRGKDVFVFRPFSSFPYHLDVLRNEKPIAVRLDMATVDCMLGTAREAVGEG